MRRLAIVVACVAVLGIAAISPPGAFASGLGPGGTFFDDDGHPAEPFIEAAVAAGMLDGCKPAQAEQFCPFMRVSLGEVERAVSLVTERVTDLSCGGEVCSTLAVPISLVNGALGFPAVLPAVLGIDPDTPTNRATLALLAASAAGLEIPEVPERRSFTLAATGDILPHFPVIAEAARYGGDGAEFDFFPMFASIQPIITAADLALCHLETPLSRDNSNLASYPVFYSPREVADAVAATGYDGCSTASNHSYDQRVEGVESTLAVVADVGLGHSGTAISDSGPSWWTYEVDGVTVAHLSYTYGLNGFRLPADQPWLVNLIDEQEILAAASAARAGGADFIVVSLHWGNEYQQQPSSYQRGIAEELSESPDVDVIIGHHAHVVQPVEKINGKFVLYGLGNLVSNQFFSRPTQDGVIALLQVSENSSGMYVRSAEFIPTIVERGTYRIVPVAAELAQTVDPDRAGWLVDSWDRTRGALASLDGSIADLVVPIR